MASQNAPRTRSLGQTLVVFVLILPVMLVMAGLALDGGYSLAQRRSAQNAADLAALAGARVMTAHVSGSTGGTDANVKASINQTITNNGGTLPGYTDAPGDPRYVDVSGNVLGFVGHGSIPGPSCSTSPATCAAGVQVGASKQWKPFFAGALAAVGLPIGNSWTASAVATARGGYRQGGPPAGNLLPIGVSKQTYDTSPICPLGVADADCTEVALTQGSLNMPGAFGWLAFGCGDKLDNNGNPYGLGQVHAGCGSSANVIKDEWGDLSANPPVAPNSYGCCSEIGLPGSGDDVESLPGNKAKAKDGDAYIDYWTSHGLVGFVPIWDLGFDNGSHAYYHIIGYAGFQITHVKGAKDITGYLRQVIFNGPVTTTSPGFAGAPLAIQLVR